MNPMTKCGAAVLALCFFLTACASQPPQPPTETTASPTEVLTPIDTAAQPETDAPIASPIDGDMTTRIHFVAAGDNIIHEAVFTDAKQNAAVLASTGGARVDYAFASMYDGLAPLISGADLAYVNHESPIARSKPITGYPDFNSPTDAGRDLLAVGFDVVNIANNHMLDMGEAGLNESIEYWNSTGATVLGACSRANYDADNLRIVEVQGIKIAFLSYAEMINWSHANALSAGSRYVVPYAKDADIKRQMAGARASGADLIFVAIHWGDEGKFQPNAEQKRLAQLLADEGADVILGSHSHNIQPVQWLTGANGNKTLVAYSTGNLISTMLYSYYMVGGLLTFDIVAEPGAEAQIENVVFVPTVTHYSMNRDSLALYRLSDYTAELAAAHGAQKNGAFTLATLQKYVTDTIDPVFLP
ncbi:MAG: CapA family protein [Clostridia bacterium]|nr:CapA family protein [Clostridia bacterium]